MTILNSTWFGATGIVKVEFDGEILFFIGTGQGWNKEEDERKIVEWGSTFDPNDPFFSVKR